MLIIESRCCSSARSLRLNTSSGGFGRRALLRLDIHRLKANAGMVYFSPFIRLRAVARLELDSLVLVEQDFGDLVASLGPLMQLEDGESCPLPRGDRFRQVASSLDDATAGASNEVQILDCVYSCFPIRYRD